MSPVRSKNLNNYADLTSTNRTSNGMSKSLSLKPRMSEKTYALSESQNIYVFEVTPGVNKLSIAQAVAAQFEVGVTSVRIAKTPAKTKRSYRRAGRVAHKGTTSSITKAYVTLKEGDKLPIFAAVEEASKKADSKEKK